MIWRTRSVLVAAVAMAEERTDLAGELPEDRIRAIGLVSGGLDSTLAAALMKGMGIEVLGVNFSTGFCVTDHKRAVRRDTDPKKLRKNDPGHPDGCPVFAYHQGYAADTAEEARRTCESGELGCVAHKKQLTEILVQQLTPLWERRAALVADPGYVDGVLEQGAARAREKTSHTMDLVWKAMKLR